MRRVWLTLIGVLAFWSCAKPPLVQMIPPPPSSIIYILNSMSADDQVCVELTLGYNDRRFTCVTIKELRYQIRGRRTL